MQAAAQFVARVERAQAVQERRRREEACAWDFRVLGHEGHADVCVHKAAGDKPCQFTYDPYPPDLGGDAKPLDTAMYEGTGIGHLYRIEGSDHHAWQLAGWNLGRETA